MEMMEILQCEGIWMELYFYMLWLPVPPKGFFPPNKVGWIMCNLRWANCSGNLFIIQPKYNLLFFIFFISEKKIQLISKNLFFPKCSLWFSHTSVHKPGFLCWNASCYLPAMFYSHCNSKLKEIWFVMDKWYFVFNVFKLLASKKIEWKWIWKWRLQNDQLYAALTALNVCMQYLNVSLQLPSI